MMTPNLCGMVKISLAAIGGTGGKGSLSTLEKPVSYFQKKKKNSHSLQPPPPGGQITPIWVTFPIKCLKKKAKKYSRRLWRQGFCGPGTLTPKPVSRFRKTSHGEGARAGLSNGVGGTPIKGQIFPLKAISGHWYRWCLPQLVKYCYQRGVG